MLGSFRSQIMHSKLIFKVFRDPKTREILSEEENEFIEKEFHLQIYLIIRTPTIKF